MTLISTMVPIGYYYFSSTIYFPEPHLRHYSNLRMLLDRAFEKFLATRLLTTWHLDRSKPFTLIFSSK